MSSCAGTAVAGSAGAYGGRICATNADMIHTRPVRTTAVAIATSAADNGMSRTTMNSIVSGTATKAISTSASAATTVAASAPLRVRA